MNTGGKTGSEFDRVISRSGTHSVKWDFASHADDLRVRPGLETPLPDRPVLAMSIADMDFQVPPCISDAVRARVDHGVFGYTAPDDDYFQAVSAWHARRQGWSVEPEWIMTYHGTVPALNLFCQALVGPGAKILVQTPAFPPFFAAIENNGCSFVCNELVLSDGRYRIDFDDLDAKAADPLVEMMILCNPHNPVGRAWTAEELSRIGEICLRHSVLLISDEVHGDLVFEGLRFVPFGSLDRDLVANTVLTTGISKTFNLAGLGLCNLIVPDPHLRDRVRRALRSSGDFGVNALTLAAYSAAYRAGEPWLIEAMGYIQANFGFLEGFLAADVPAIKPIMPEATYLVWLDCRGLGLDHEGLESLMIDRAGVKLESGRGFGPGGDGFMRMNIACPRSVMEAALQRIAEAVARVE